MRQNAFQKKKRKKKGQNVSKYIYKTFKVQPVCESVKRESSIQHSTINQKW